MRPPPWIYPPDNYLPFIYSTDPFNTTLNVEAVLGTFTTLNRWCRVAAIELDDQTVANNLLRIDGQGWGDLAEFMPFGDSDTPGGDYPMEIPIFAMLPPSSFHTIRFIGNAITGLTVRLTGFYL